MMKQKGQRQDQVSREEKGNARTASVLKFCYVLLWLRKSLTPLAMMPGMRSDERSYFVGFKQES